MAKQQTPRMDPQEARVLRVRRRRRHRMVFRILCCVLVCVAAIMATTVFFRVSEIQVSGDTRYSAEELIGTSGVEDGDNLFFLHSKSVIRSLENTYPYLDTVKLRRHLPGTLEIAVTERVPLLTVQLSDGSLYYLDETGKVLERFAKERATPVTVMTIGTGVKKLTVGQTVTTDSGEKIMEVLELLRLAEKYEMQDKITTVDISKSFAVEFLYVDGENSYTIELGTLDDLEHKIQFLRSVLEKDDLPSTGTIDLSANNEARYRPAEYESPVAEEEEQQEQDGQTEETADEQTEKSDESDKQASEEGETETDDTETSDTTTDSENDSSGDSDPEQTE
ncbi:MAG: cell division protein FtsQ/DivIB [Butyricicoccus sp.]